MANEKASPAPAAAAPAAEGAAPKKKPMKLVIVAVAVLGLEIGTVAVTMSLSSGPKRVVAETPVPVKVDEVVKDAEVKLVEGRLPNSQGGVMHLYDLQVVAKVADKNKAKVTEEVTERDAEIRDQVRTIIASSDPKSLAEPGLETLKRQISYQIEQDIGKDLIKDVLIPKCTQLQY